MVEELGVCFGQHEMTSKYRFEVFEFFLQHVGIVTQHNVGLQQRGMLGIAVAAFWNNDHTNNNNH